VAAKGPGLALELAVGLHSPATLAVQVAGHC
jgi:hypothetical protein